MSSVNTKFAVLALAGSALAVPNFGHGHHAKQQHHHHSKHFFGSSGIATGTGAPYGLANATGIWGTGTGVSAHGLVASTGLASGFPRPNPVGPETASQVAAVTTSTCTDSVVRVTHTNRVTVTVHASEAAPVHTTMSTRVHSSSVALSSSVSVISSSAASSSSVVVSSSAPASSASISLNLGALENKGYNGVNHRKNWRSSTSTAAASSAAAQSTSETSVAPVPSSTSTSVYVAPTTSVYVAPTSSAVAASSSSAQASSTSSSIVAKSSSSGSGKRGLAYNAVSDTTCFSSYSKVTWAYNWDSEAGGDLASNFNYVPLLWGTTNGHADVWNERATAAIANGATHLMSFNEPDMPEQANMSPEAAASAYKEYMMPFAGKALLGAPAVTNGGGSMGLNWLSAFMDACDGCQIDFVSIHWYDSFSNTAYFKEHVQNATDVSGKPVWVTEFAPTDGSSSDISSFLEDVMPWMDSQDFVERYSYFMASNGKLLSGTEPSDFGMTYATS